MEKENLSDLEKMNASRRQAEKEYMESRKELLEVKRIMQEGIRGVEELILYLRFGINDAKTMEDMARKHNNSIVYSEAIAVKREFSKLLALVMLSEFVEPIEEDGTEESHRANNTGDEAYV